MSQEDSGAGNSEQMLRFERNFISGILETTSAFIAVLDIEGRVLRLNRAIELMTGITILDAVGSVFWEIFILGEERQAFMDLFGDLQSDRFPFEAQGRLGAARGKECHVLWSCTPICNDADSVDFVIVTGIDVTALKRVQRENENLILELQAALAKVKTLKGLLPMCANCQKIRDDHGQWHHVEEYIRDHSDADFTHGICPECANLLYPQFTKDWYPDGGKK
jgi:PAS domain S-box-containing protein